MSIIAFDSKSMLKGLLFLLLVYIGFSADPISAQSNYTPGHIVTVKQDTIDGLIDYRNWRRNPESIKFKKDSLSTPEKYDRFQIESFQVGSERYISRKVEIDRTPVKAGELVEVPVIDTDRIFLLRYLEGEASLYYYMNDKPHFYILKGGKLYELFNRKLLLNRHRKKIVVDDEQYKSQLKNFFRECTELREDIEHLNYKEDEMVHIFEKYNQCIGGSIVYAREKNKTQVDIQFKFGPGFSQPILSNSLGSSSIGSYNRSIDPALGISFDIFLPRNLGKWSFYNEFLFLSRYSNEATTDTKLGGSYLKLSNMIRYRLFQPPDGPFINAGITNAYGIYTNNEMNQHIINTVGETSTRKSRKYLRGFAAGLGVQKRKINFEVRYEWDKAPQSYKLFYQVNTLYLIVGITL